MRKFLERHRFQPGSGDVVLRVAASCPQRKRSPGTVVCKLWPIVKYKLNPLVDHERLQGRGRRFRIGALSQLDADQSDPSGAAEHGRWVGNRVDVILLGTECEGTFLDLAVNRVQVHARVTFAPVLKPRI